MYTLIDCTDPTFDPIFNIIGLVVKVIWWGIPIALIIFASIDLGKVVISSKDEDIKKFKKRAVDRLIYAVLVFAVVWIVKTVIHLFGSLGFVDQNKADEWENCWNEIF